MTTANALPLVGVLQMSVLFLGCHSVAVSGKSMVRSCSLTPSNGLSYEWPSLNPGLVAPVAMNFTYQSYSDPLISELTNSSLVVYIPPDFVANFELVNFSAPSGSKAPLQKYVLELIEIRKPAMVPQGADQVVNHILEVALLHREVTGTGYWANVVVPLEVRADATGDLLAPLLDQATLPTNVGQTEPLLIGTSLDLNLSSVFQNASFQHFWTLMPSRCNGSSTGVRMFMRNATLITSQASVNRLLGALQWIPSQPPTLPPEVTWQVFTCPAGSTCTATKAASLSTTLTQVTAAQTAANTTLVAAKAAMDASLVALNSTNISNSVYNQAVYNKNALIKAAQAINGAMATVFALQAMINQTTSAKFDSDAPPFLPNVSNTANSTTAAPTATPAVSAKPSLIAVDSSEALTACTQKLHAPLDVDLSKDAQHVDALTAGASQAILFWRLAGTSGLSPADAAEAESRAESPMLNVINLGDQLQISKPEGKPLLQLLINGTQFPVTFATLSVPGQHAIGKQRAAAEIQFVQLPSSVSEPAIGVALQLDEVKDGSSNNNVWLEQLFASVNKELPEAGHDTVIRGTDPLTLHQALTRGIAGRFYRYTGQLSRSTQCRLTNWHILEERGRISTEQLLVLKKALLPAGSSSVMHGPSALPALFLAAATHPAESATTVSRSQQPVETASATPSRVSSLRALLLSVPRQQRAEAAARADKL
jgi:carbonic anhydrase